MNPRVKTDCNYKLIEPGIYSNGNMAGGTSYDAKARIYEFLVSTMIYNRIAWGTSPSDYIAFARYANGNSKGSIIDVGCGGLAQTVDGYSQIRNELVLVDNSIEMLRIARKRLLRRLQHLPENILLLQADAFNLPYEETFDNLFSFGMLHLFDDKAEYLDKILKPLKKGGRLFLSSLTTDRKISEKYMAILRKNGEMGTGLKATELLRLFQGRVGKVNSYVIGSMIFIHGVK